MEVMLENYGSLVEYVEQNLDPTISNSLRLLGVS